MRLFSMISPIGSHTRVARWCRVASRTVPVIALAGCSGIADWVTPGDRAETLPAQVALNAAVHASTSAADIVALEVVSQYVRRDGSRQRMGASSIPLSTRATQAVPIPIDLGGCLADSERDAATPTERVCPVVLTLSLVVNGGVLDRQVIGPLRLAPGGTTNVAQPVSLFEISRIQLEVGPGATRLAGDTVVLALGGTVPFRAKVLDRDGGEVTDRAIEWSSATPTIASIASNTGTVTAIGLGSSQITASIGTHSQSLSLRVVRPPAALSVTAGDGSGSGRVRSTPAGIDCRIDGTTTTGACRIDFAGDARVVLTATADAGSTPPTWGDDCAGGAVGSDTVTCQLTMDKPRTARLSYTALRRVTVRGQDGDGRGRVSGSFGVDCLVDGTAATGTCAVDVPDGATVALTAVAEEIDSPQSFEGWGGECASTTGAACTLIVRGNARDVGVRFRAARRLSVAVDGTGAGEVVATDGRSCVRANGRSLGSCDRDLKHGTVVSLTAVPNEGSVFAGWSGACTAETSVRCAVTMSQARTVQATFTAMRRVSVRAAAGDGRGRVTGPGGLDCLVVNAVTSGVCAVDVTDSARYALVATPDAAAATTQFFAGWGGDCVSASTPSCTLTINGASRDVVVRFVDQPRVRVELGGNGAGRVSAMSAGIACLRASGATTGVCDRPAAFGALVTLTATAGPTSTFVGWSGACESTAGTTCTTTATRAQTVSATFSLRREPLKLTISGASAGTIEVNGVPACSLRAGQSSVTCTVSFDVGTTVQLRAVAAQGGRFAGFAGDCNGAAPCMTVMSDARQVSARFDVAVQSIPAAVNVTLSGKQSGSVRSSSAGIDCVRSGGVTSGTCSANFVVGATVTFTATLGPQSRIEAWTGACAQAVGTSCTLTLSKDVTLGVAFSKVP